MRRIILTALLVGVSLVALGGCACGTKRDIDGAGQKAIVQHMEKLKTGDVHVEYVPFHDANVPFHLWKVIERGVKAGPVLLGYLEDDAAVPISYRGILGFAEFRVVVGDPVVIQATMRDLADYALRHIYKVDVGYRPYLAPAARGKAVRRWEDVVWRECSGN